MGNAIPLDQDIRKVIGTIINYQRIDNHLSHQELADIKVATANNKIDWPATMAWFHHNSHPIGTSPNNVKQHKWIVQILTNTLPTLDLLNQRYPCLLNGFSICFQCNSATETNHHFWKCLARSALLYPDFQRLAAELETFLLEHGDQLTWSVKDSIHFSPIFRWTTQPFSIGNTIPFEIYLIARNYVPMSFYKLIRLHCSRQKLAFKVLFAWMKACLDEIKLHVWKPRSSLWKQWKQNHHLTKKDFKDYSKKFSRHVTLPRPLPRPRSRAPSEYVNPLADFRNFKLSSDYLFILFTSSNFLHSGTFYNHLYSFNNSHNMVLPKHFTLFYV